MSVGRKFISLFGTCEGCIFAGIISISALQEEHMIHDEKWPAECVREASDRRGRKKMRQIEKPILGDSAFTFGGEMVSFV